jgi:hypothetical protein
MKIDYESLYSDGYTILRGIVPPEMCTAFESDLDTLGVAGLQSRGRNPSLPDPIADLLGLGGLFRETLFTNLKYLRSVQNIGQHVVNQLDAAGFLNWLGYKTLVAYPTVRADVPGEEKYLLPMHQDYATPCRSAFRVWATLRPADEDQGSLVVVPGSHTGGLIIHDTSDPARPYVPEVAYDRSKARILELEAGDGILFDPLLVHGSVPARNGRMKYNLLVNLWDLTTLADPDDHENPLVQRLEMRRTRDKARG